MRHSFSAETQQANTQMHDVNNSVWQSFGMLLLGFCILLH